MSGGIKGLTLAEQRMCAMAGSLPRAEGQKETGIWGTMGQMVKSMPIAQIWKLNKEITGLGVDFGKKIRS